MMPEIPFLPEFKEAIANGGKTATSRSKRYGNSGDYFKATGLTLQFTHVVKVPLLVVAEYFYRFEGFKTKNEFIACWNRIHKRKKFEDEPLRMVWLHLWRKLGQ